MDIRKTKPEDIDDVMSVYEAARKFMVSSGNPNQWKPGYPTRSMIEEDVRLSRHYVCVEDDRIECVFMYMEDPDPTYACIEDGAWPNDKPYGTMHRIASAGKVRHIADFCLSWCFDQCGNLRADTHRDNKVMQRVLERNGFKYCGVIRLHDGSPRLAYQKW